MPDGGLLVGEIDGVLAAALSLASGGAIADPFRPTAALLELLAQRARQLRGETLPAKLGAALRSSRKGAPRGASSVSSSSSRRARGSRLLLENTQAKIL